MQDIKTHICLKKENCYFLVGIIKLESFKLHIHIGMEIPFHSSRKILKTSLLIIEKLNSEETRYKIIIHYFSTKITHYFIRRLKCITV